MTAILITGADGFVGRNLAVHLRERRNLTCLVHTRADGDDAVGDLVRQADVIVHLAGANRPACDDDFERDNADFTRLVCDAARRAPRAPTILLASSTKAAENGPYAQSKRAAEALVTTYGRETGAPVHVERFPNIFGKWSRPNYNSVFATFCYNVARGIDVVCHDPETIVTAAYVDDVCLSIIDAIERSSKDGTIRAFTYPVYDVGLVELRDILLGFRRDRSQMQVDRVGAGFLRKLYATYLSFLPPDDFALPLTEHADERGSFVEMLKTRDSGQLSYFTARPGVTRGRHYHHTKSEKFLVVRGNALFRSQNLATLEERSQAVSGDYPIVVDSIPGWTHDITNVGDEDMVVMLWASEQFDRDQPDTYARAVGAAS